MMKLYIKLNYEGINGFKANNTTIDSVGRVDKEICQFYYLESDNPFFQYIDAFKSLIPADSAKCWWDWGGIRKDSSYYIDIHTKPDADYIPNIENAIAIVFGSSLKTTDRFELPELDAPEIIRLEDVWNNEDEEDDDEYDEDEVIGLEDEELRTFENKTGGMNGIQRERTYSEPNGADGLTFIGAVTGLVNLLYQIVKDFEEHKREEKWEKTINRLRSIIIRTYGEGNGYIDPTHETERIYNPKYKTQDYVFIQLVKGNQRRMIRITPDGKHTMLMGSVSEKKHRSKKR